MILIILFHLLHLTEFPPATNLLVLLITVVRVVCDVLKGGRGLGWLTPPRHCKGRAEEEKEREEEEEEGVRFVCHAETETCCPTEASREEG